MSEPPPTTSGLRLPDALAHALSTFAQQQSGAGDPHDGRGGVRNQSLWIPLQLGGLHLFYDPQSGHLWREISDTGSDVDTDVTMQEGGADGPRATEEGPDTDGMIFDDPDIAMAVRIATGASPAPRIDSYHSIRHVPPSYGQYSRSSGPSRPPRRGSSSTLLERIQDDTPTLPEGTRDDTPTLPEGTQDHASTLLERTQDEHYGSDTESPPRLSREAKGKSREPGNGLRQDGMSDVSDPPLGTAAPVYQDGKRGDLPATVDDIVRLGATIRLGQVEMADRIIAGLRPQPTRSTRFQDPVDEGEDGDDEAPGTRVNLGGKRKGGGVRSPWENRLSEKIRAHMEECIRDPDWMTDSVSEAEFRDFDPLLGPCCTPDSLRLHFEGTPCDRWNKSATDVFIEDFLEYHPEYPGHSDVVRDMVHLKTRSAITSMIKEYRRLKLHPNERKALQERKNRLERKRGLFNRRMNLTFFYPSLLPHRHLLEQLGVAGMSSDEEEDEEDQAMDQGGDEILPFKQYLIRVPQWRSEAVTGFLRVFDILYLRARADGVFGGQRGAFPHARSTSLARSTNLRFVSRLPENAYDERWLRGLVDRAVLRARPPVAYHHSPETLQLAYGTRV